MARRLADYAAELGAGEPDEGGDDMAEGDDYGADLEAEAQKFADATKAGDAKAIAAAFRAMHDLCNEKV
jgi:hypothetical protein